MPPYSRPHLPAWLTLVSRFSTPDSPDNPDKTARHQERRPLHPTLTPIMFALQFCAYTMHQSRSDPSATLMVMMRELRMREADLRTGATSRGNR